MTRPDYASLFSIAYTEIERPELACADETTVAADPGACWLAVLLDTVCCSSSLISMALLLLMLLIEARKNRQGGVQDSIFKVRAHSVEGVYVVKTKWQRRV